MPFEIDFLPVGDASKSGDAIALRYGNLNGPRHQQVVVTIDGGTKASGQALAEHVARVYGTTVVDIAFLTHPDMDHSSGMRCVLEQLRVKQVVMHLPWGHSGDVLRLVDDDRVTSKSLKNRAIDNLTAAKEVADLARRCGADIVEPFAGVVTSGGEITVLGPTVEFYQKQLANFRFMPGTQDSSKTTTFSGYREYQPIVEHESWTVERLGEPSENASSAENNSSAIILLQVDGCNVLLTGDAGVPAISAALDYADWHQIKPSSLNLFQVPHHGSRKNLSTSLLNRLFGRPEASVTGWNAVVSAAPQGAPKHPNKKVTNALQRRGAKVTTTEGGVIQFSKGIAPRLGYGPLVPTPFYSVVEGDGLTE